MDSLISEDTVSKLRLDSFPHPVPYDISWFKDDNVAISCQCSVNYEIGAFKDSVLCSILP